MPVARIEDQDEVVQQRARQAGRDYGYLVTSYSRHVPSSRCVACAVASYPVDFSSSNSDVKLFAINKTT